MFIHMENQMVPNIEQYMSSGKAFLESQTTAFTTLATTALESAEKVATLNLAAFKASAADASNVLSQATNARDPQEFFAMITSQVQPNAEKAASYARYLGEIVAEAQSVFSKAFESQIAEVSRAGAAMVDQLSASAPAGSSDALALVKSMMGTANAAYEQLNKTAKQTGEAIQAQTAGLSAQYGQSVKAMQTAAADTEAA
jgi:phasin family protein